MHTVAAAPLSSPWKHSRKLLLAHSHSAFPGNGFAAKICRRFAQECLLFMSTNKQFRTMISLMQTIGHTFSYCEEASEFFGCAMLMELHVCSDISGTGEWSS